MKAQEGEPVEQVEAEVRRLLDADAFLEHHARAHDRWAAALSELWEAETAAQFTDIRHACREAMQLFVTDLVQQHDPPDVESDPQKTVARLKAVLAKVQLPDAVKEFGWLPGDNHRTNEGEMVENRPMERFAFRAQDKDGNYADTFTLEPVGERTKVTFRLEFVKMNGMAAFMAPMLFPLIAKPDNRKRMRLLKAKVEASQA
jgi:hypothetical protein